MRLRRAWWFVSLLTAGCGLVCWPVAAADGVGGSDSDQVFYLGGPGDQRLQCAHRLSDGSVLVGGGTTDAGWLGDGAVRLATPASPGGPSGRVGFLLHLSADLKKLLGAYVLPKDFAVEVTRIRSTEVPGEKTGAVYLSGGLAKAAGKNGKTAYFLGRLDGNFVDGAPSALEWVIAAKATGALLADQAWDVTGTGDVYYAQGEPYSYNWMAVESVDAAGMRRVVPNWRRHWYKQADGKLAEFAGLAKDAPGEVQYSAIVLKTWGRGDFRSWNRADFEEKSSDGNGGVKQGRWPFDAMFSGYFDPETKKTAEVTGTKKGYYGYRWGNTPCAHVGAIVVDRRTGQIFIGGNNKSKLPDGKPDFEPWVVAMERDGGLRWWQRLYGESAGVSTPDQYVDQIAIDYSRPASPGSILVVARAHGNNVNNFWGGDKIRHPKNPGRGFQNGFTGTHGNMHFSWIGRMTIADGTMANATYFAEFAEGAKHQDKRFADSLLDHWPHFRAGWPDLNTTRCRSLAVDDGGNVLVAALGRRVITTKNAYMQMPSPVAKPGTKGAWSSFARVYRPDLIGLRYSSILNGKWDWATGKGAANLSLRQVIPVPGGLLAVGYEARDKKTGELKGNAMPTRNVADYGSDARQGEMGVVARFRFE